MNTVIIILLCFVIAVIVWAISKASAVNSQLSRDIANQAGQIQTIAKTLENYRQSQDGLKDTISKTVQLGQNSVSKSIQNNLQTMGELKKQLGELLGANEQMTQLGEDVKRLGNILASSKMRGQMGEWSLENLLSDILPAGAFQLQYEFADGKKVDALITMKDYSVPIDAKFPLPNFEAILQAEDEAQKTKSRNKFLSDISRHINKIAEQYIKPNEGTVDFALMYIPAENIYYEAIIKQQNDNLDILKYALDKKVIPVSPNLCYVYLMTVAMGLHGLTIEKQAEQIRQGLISLKDKFTSFVSTWELVGKHLRNTSNQYQEGQIKLSKFETELNEIKKDRTSQE